MTVVQQTDDWLLDWKRYFCFLVSTVYQAIPGPSLTKILKYRVNQAEKRICDLEKILPTSSNLTVENEIEFEKECILKIKDLLPERKGPQTKTDRRIWLGLLRGLEKAHSDENKQMLIYEFLTGEFVEWQNRVFFDFPEKSKKIQEIENAGKSSEEIEQSKSVKIDLFVDGDLRIFTLTKWLESEQALLSIHELRKTAWRGLLINGDGGRKAFSKEEKKTKKRLTKHFEDYDIPDYHDSPHFPFSGPEKNNIQWAFVDF